MGLVLLIWLGFSLIACGIGMLVIGGIFRLAVDRAMRAVESFWIGWGMIIAFLQIWHLFIPISPMALIILVIPAVVGWVWQGGALLPVLRGALNSQTKRVLIVIWLLICLWLA